MIAPTATPGGAARIADAVALTSPERAFVAYRLRQALDVGDVVWLERCALPWLEFICPPGVDPVTKHAALLDLARQCKPVPETLFAVQLRFAFGGEEL